MTARFRMRALGCAVAAAIASLAHAQEGGDAAAPTLRMARELMPPAVRRAARAAPGAPAAPARPTTRLIDEDEPRGVVFLRADRLEGFGEKRVEAAGNVELRARRETVLADWLEYDFDREEVHARGSVVLRRGSDWITGPELTYRRNAETGQFDDPRFFVGELGARGDASKLVFAGPDRYDVADGRYTTCVAPRNDWFLQTDSLEIDTGRMVGTAHNATVRFFDVPIFYSPYLTFPLNNERKSGFLTPTAGSTGSRGFELSTPYYFNLAPNYDATVTPRIMTRRGLQVGGQLRYLFSDVLDVHQPMQGEIDAEFLPDRQTETNRWAFAWKHVEEIVPSLGLYWNLNKVSDDTYFADLADRIAITSQTTLPREAGLAWSQGPWSVLARVQSFQTLQDPNAPILPPYNRLPHILASLNEWEWAGLTFSGYGDYSRFRSSQLTQGDRAVLYPTVAWSRSGPGWFFNARTGAHLRQYSLDESATEDRNRSLAIPISSVDAGLIFERNWQIFGRDFIHTLEPRAFYAYIPFHEQSKLPNFDSALDDFNFSQLFAENRYLGNDRIGDANQLTIALSSRLLEPANGAERLRVAIGQRFYFQQQRVTLNESPRSAQSSDLLLAMEGRITDAWALQGLLQQNLDSGTNERLNLGVRYTPAPGKALNLSYRYTRQFGDPTISAEQIKQIDVSGQWPLDANWNLIGRWNYSIPDRKTLEAIAGVEYNRDCWILRLVVHRLTTTTEQTNTSVFVQLEFNGLARVGTSPLDLLRRSVPGYLRSNDPSLERDRSFEPLPEF